MKILGITGSLLTLWGTALGPLIYPGEKDGRVVTEIYRTSRRRPLSLMGRPVALRCLSIFLAARSLCIRTPLTEMPRRLAISSIASPSIHKSRMIARSPAVNLTAPIASSRGPGDSAATSESSGVFSRDTTSVRRLPLRVLTLYVGRFLGLETAGRSPSLALTSHGIFSIASRGVSRENSSLVMASNTAACRVATSSRRAASESSGPRRSYGAGYATATRWTDEAGMAAVPSRRTGAPRATTSPRPRAS